MRTSHKTTRFFVTSAIALGLSLTMLVSTAKPVQAQNAASAHKVALIDMAHLFNEYNKFKDLREQLKGEITQKDETAKLMQKELQAMAAQIKSGSLKPGSPDYEKIETKILNMNSQFEIFKKKAKRDFVLREAQIYKEVYLEVAKAVDQYATFYKYTAVLRFSRKKVDETDDPRELIKNMNNQVVWSDKNADITDEVLKYLNGRYKPTARTATGPTGTSTK